MRGHAPEPHSRNTKEPPGSQPIPSPWLWPVHSLHSASEQLEGRQGPPPKPVGVLEPGLPRKQGWTRCRMHCHGLAPSDMKPHA